ncbi:sterol desaturase family protein [Pseudooceanicola aestuarii]|uniref:sterol desaturase family protein n=1 Tax=Pseudooceanicola aestuarii TaxID=2697319 RepID=UPI0013D153EE|nr:sterol desaturase family protein [Pseudooceanicola aestuarii]
MDQAAAIRLPIFLGLFTLFALAEAWAPRRARAQKRPRRWLTNWGISIGGTVMLRLMALGLPLLSIGAALDAQAGGWGLFNRLGWPAAAEVAASVLILDFAIWFQHLATHKVPLLWRLHQVHHADRDVDVTTAIRFHPLEIGLSMLWKIGLIYALGPSALAVLLFEIILNGTAMFNHANLNLPPWLDRWMRLVIVTPDMHRVHHSVHRDETDSNYGFAFSLWDRLFRTYSATPRDGHDGMVLGLGWQDERPSRLGWSLWLPFRR